MVEKQKKIEANKKLYFTWSLHDYDVKKEGVEANKLENARKLLTMKLLTHEQISEAVGLPLEKIEELASNIVMPTEA